MTGPNAVGSSATLDRPRPRVDPRIAARRAEVHRARRRRRLRAVVIVAVVAGLALGTWGITRSALLDVDRVVVTGARQSTADEVLSAARLAEGDQLVDVDPARAAQAIEALPWVATARVERHWLDGEVRIHLTEREPVVVAVDGAGWLMVDATGRVLAPATEAMPLPVVEGLDAAPAGGEVGGDGAGAVIDLARNLEPGLESRIDRFVLDDGALSVHLRPQGRALLGAPVDLEEKVRTLTTVLARTDLECLAVVDLRVPDMAFLTREDACE